MSKIRISLSGNPVAAQLIVLLFNMRTVTHIAHLNTGNGEEHRALNDFYDAIIPLADRFAEVSIATFGKVDQWPENLTDGLVINMASAAYLKQCKASIETLVPQFQQADVSNILAEIIELCSQTIYKLENLK